jgi:hypothetical protein
MARKKLPDDALLVVLTRAVGIRKAMKVLTFVVSWGIVIEDTGEPPESIEAYADWWRSSHRSAYREQALYREALPGEDTPTRLWSFVRAHVDPHDTAAPAVLGTLRVAL